jgi:predicted RNase H-like HicB family nuclease/predicted RNA binding protein YcfA (HicA-like mRNA interferase family)
MSKRAKLLAAIRSNPSNVRFEDLVSLLTGLGFIEARHTGSHKQFKHPRHPEVHVTLQDSKGEVQMKAFPYRVVVEWSDEDKVYLARVPALQSCVSHGDTESDAIAMVKEAASLILADLKARKKPTPPSDRNSAFSGNLRLRIPQGLHASLSTRATAEGVSLNQLMVSMLSK